MLKPILVRKVIVIIIVMIFSDYDNIIAPLDKMIMLHFQLGLENSHFLRFEGLFSPGQSRSKTLG